MTPQSMRGASSAALTGECLDLISEPGALGGVTFFSSGGIFWDFKSLLRPGKASSALSCLPLDQLTTDFFTDLKKGVFEMLAAGSPLSLASMR